MTFYTVFRQKKFKSRDAIRGLDMHNKRQFAHRDNVDTDFSRYNVQLVGNADTSLVELSDRHIKERVTGRIRKETAGRNASVRLIEQFASATRDFFLPGPGARLDASGRYDADKLEEWTRCTLEYVQRLYGPENVLAAVLHMDETTPHIHFDIVPITPDGRLSAQDWVSHGGKLSQQQTDYAHAVEHLGLERGKEGSTAKHTELKTYYRAVKSAFRDDALKIKQLPQGPAPEKPGLFASSEKKEAYEQYNEDCRNFVELIKEEGMAIALRSDALTGTQIQKEKAEKAAAEEKKRRLQAEAEAARYKALYAELKTKLDAKHLRALGIASIAALLGYEKAQDGMYKLGQHSVHITEKSYEFQQVGAYGRNVIDFMCEHLRLTEGRPEVTPAEAIVRLAALVHDDAELRETALAGLADRAEEWLDGLKGEIDRARQPPREPESLEHQPGRQEVEQEGMRM